MKQISCQELIVGISDVVIDRSDKYLLTYPGYISYFFPIQELTNEDIYRGIGFVYSWMPRVLSVSESSIEAFKKRSVKFKKDSNDVFSEELIGMAKLLTGGSIVAASKLLHFMFPNDFPIYDSHIYKYCWGKQKSHYYQVNSVRNYDSYKSALSIICNDPKIEKLIMIVEKKIGYRVSRMRAVEFSIFSISRTKGPI